MAHALKNYIQKLSHKKRLQCSLIISSSKAPNANKKAPDDNLALSNFVDRSIFAVSVEGGMRSVQSSITAAFPTVNAVQESLDLAKRSGAQVVIGVGSGAAIDLAKAVATMLAVGSENVELVLSPATLGGCIASTSVEPLILSTEEEALLPLWSAFQNDNEKQLSRKVVSPTILFNENDLFTCSSSAAHLSHGVIASLTIALDSALYVSERSDLSRENNDSINKAVDNAIDALLRQDLNNESRMYHASNAVHCSGKLLNIGKSDFRRSAPISIASALLPPFFPHGNLLTYISSMLPGVCEAIAQQKQHSSNLGDKYLQLENIASRLTGGGKGSESLSHLAKWADQISKECEIPTMASLAEGAPTISTLLDSIDCNHALLNIDYSEEEMNYLGEIVQRSLDR